MDLDQDLVRPVAQRDVHRGVVAVQAHVGLEKVKRVVVVVVFIIKRKCIQSCGPDCLATNDITVLYHYDETESASWEILFGPSKKKISVHVANVLVSQN